MTPPDLTPLERALALLLLVAAVLLRLSEASW